MESFVAGRWVSRGSYRTFEPMPITRTWSVTDMRVQQLLSQADRELGRLDMYSTHVPNLELFISMHVTKEAAQSSKIEGTQTRIEEALLDREDVPVEKRDDWEEVQNYIAALDHAVETLATVPFSSRLICDAHRVLMRGVRGAQKAPGQFRRTQNWIGGATIDDAVFVPPSSSSVPELMTDLERFVHSEEILLPDLLKIALVHYQFETIHPFLDGNGRVGRLLIPIYLVERRILKRPILYLSDFLERNRSLYYDNLMRVREKNDLDQWFRFFLIGVIETAKSGIATFDAILKLRNEVDERVRQLGRRAANAAAIVDHLYQRPLVDAAGVVELIDVSMPTAYKLIDDLEGLGILRETTGARRGRMYVFDEYLRLFTE